MKHIHRALCSLLALALIACLCALPAAAADEPSWKSSYRDTISKNTDKYGSVCQLADFNLDGTPELIIGGNNYFKLCDLGETLGFDVGWDKSAGLVTVTTGE